MSRGGRFGKYGEHKRLSRLRDKRLKPVPLKIVTRFEKRKPPKPF